MNKERLIVEAIRAIDLFETRRPTYSEINAQIKEVCPDFPPLIQHIDSETEGALVGLLDEVLDFAGEELASYYLYEGNSTKGPNTRRVIETDGTEWPLTNIIELEAYVRRDQALAQKEKKMTTWLEDKDGNKCSVEYFGSREAAQKALDTLVGCDNCINCRKLFDEAAELQEEVTRLREALEGLVIAYYYDNGGCPAIVKARQALAPKEK